MPLQAGPEVLVFLIRSRHEAIELLSFVLEIGRVALVWNSDQLLHATGGLIALGTDDRETPVDFERFEKLGQGGQVRTQQIERISKTHAQPACFLLVGVVFFLTAFVSRLR